MFISFVLADGRQIVRKKSRVSEVIDNLEAKTCIVYFDGKKNWPCTVRGSARQFYINHLWKDDRK